jgi:hypothetical protein
VLNPGIGENSPNTLVYFRVLALKQGPASFDGVASFNNGREDGARFTTRVL